MLWAAFLFCLLLNPDNLLLDYKEHNSSQDESFCVTGIEISNSDINLQELKEYLSRFIMVQFQICLLMILFLMELTQIKAVS